MSGALWGFALGSLVCVPLAAVGALVLAFSDRCGYLSYWRAYWIRVSSVAVVCIPSAALFALLALTVEHV